jgi:hypothetical protein
MVDVNGGCEWGAYRVERPMVACLADLVEYQVALHQIPTAKTCFKPKHVALEGVSKEHFKKVPLRRSLHIELS